MKRHTPLVLLALAAALALPACHDDDRDAPPQVHIGRDQCAECGMILSEQRFAGVLTIERDGAREHLLFDDLGDMFDHEAAHPDLHIVARYVQDFDGSGWIPAQSAHFLSAESIPTPMRSGLVAFASTDACAAAHARYAGAVLTYQAARDQRTASPPSSPGD